MDTDPCLDMALLLQQDTIIAKIEKEEMDSAGPSQGLPPIHITPKSLEAQPHSSFNLEGLLKRVMSQIH